MKLFLIRQHLVVWRIWWGKLLNVFIFSVWCETINSFRRYTKETHGSISLVIIHVKHNKKLLKTQRVSPSTDLFSVSSLCVVTVTSCVSWQSVSCFLSVIQAEDSYFSSNWQLWVKHVLFMHKLPFCSTSLTWCTFYWNVPEWHWHVCRKWRMARLHQEEQCVAF